MPMLKFITLLVLPFALNAQQDDQFSQYNTASDTEQHHRYFPMSEEKIYDVEIIVFAYNNPLPEAQTYRDKSIIDSGEALVLQNKPNNLSEILINSPSDQSNQELSNTATQNDSEYTVEIGEQVNEKKVLAWYQHNAQDLTMKAIWQRLINASNIQPLVHKSWRQPQTSFNDPVYVKLTSDNMLDQSQFSANTNQTYENADELQNQDSNRQFNDRSQKVLMPDFSLSGMVALSKGRFMHFAHQLKLYRQYDDDEGFTKNMSFSLTERRQVKTNELYYFDSPWLGSIVKITEFTGETAHE